MVTLTVTFIHEFVRISFDMNAMNEMYLTVYFFG